MARSCLTRSVVLNIGLKPSPPAAPPIELGVSGANVATLKVSTFPAALKRTGLARLGKILLVAGSVLAVFGYAVTKAPSSRFTGVLGLLARNSRAVGRLACKMLMASVVCCAGVK